MQIRIRIVYAMMTIFFFNATTLQAMSFSSVVGFVKVCCLAVAKKSGSTWMVRAARLTNHGTSLALGSDYNQRCVRNYADVLNDSRCDLIDKVIRNGDEEGVEFLLDPKECLKCFQGTEQDPTLLHVALRAKKYHAARVLLQMDMDPNRPGKAPFSDQLRPPIVEFARDINAVLLLLEFGADLDWCDDNGGSIYGELIANDEWEIVSILHDKGLKLNAQDFLIALDKKDKLIEYELTGFLRQLGIKQSRPSSKSFCADKKHGGKEDSGESGKTTIKHEFAGRNIKEVMAILHTMPRKEKHALFRFMINRGHIGTKHHHEDE